MPAIRIELRVTCATPPSVGSGGSEGTLADKVVLRDGRGRFILPGSQVKGRLRHACEQLVKAYKAPVCRPPRPDTMCPNYDEDPTLEPPCLLCRIFGGPGQASPLRFHDLVAQQPALPEQTLRAMVSLNRARRTAEPQRLFLIETAPHYPGLEFRNEEAITGHVKEPAHAHLLLAAARMLFTWGGGSSRGLGWGRLDTVLWLGGTETPLDTEKVRSLCPR
jgi:CRISPR/Cas system CSM-associated protein Csm3 (group 7 of RAMP superfamily)